MVVGKSCIPNFVIHEIQDVHENYQPIEIKEVLTDILHKVKIGSCELVLRSVHG